jgi:hypothetical protein
MPVDIYKNPQTNFNGTDMNVAFRWRRQTASYNVWLDEGHTKGLVEASHGNSPELKMDRHDR